jgi:hypothetical protein
MERSLRLRCPRPRSETFLSYVMLTAVKRDFRRSRGAHSHAFRGLRNGRAGHCNGRVISSSKLVLEMSPTSSQHNSRQFLVGEFHFSAVCECLDPLFVWHGRISSRRYQGEVATIPCSGHPKTTPLIASRVHSFACFCAFGTHRFCQRRRL